MPGGDRTGPMGMGPVTGRGAGFCSGFGAPGYMNQVPMGGFGARIGNWCRGRRYWVETNGQPGGMRGGWSGFPSGPMAYGPNAEKQTLEQEVKGLQFELARIQKRLNELLSTKGEE
jgi:uncharacterized protein DUF5320